MPVISTNTAANSAVRYLNINASEQSQSLSKLASGSRITKASDDAAGLAISTRIQSDVTALEQAATNASHGISVLQTADGGASNISDILQRMKALASESASGTVTDTERSYINAEFSQLIDEVNGTATSTRYNGQSLLDGTSSFSTGVTVMVGSDASDTITVKLATLTANALGLSNATAVAPTDLVGGSANITLAAGATASFQVNGTTVTIGDAASTKSQTVTMADVATAINTALGPVTGNTVTASVNATSGKLTLANSATGASASTALTNFTGITASMLGFSKTSSTGSDAGDLSVATQPGANRALDTIDSAIDTVSKTRADIGATESRFEFRAETIATSTENLTAANSAITDVDVASEEAKLASAAVKTQAAVAAAAQANQMPQELLKLMQ